MKIVVGITGASGSIYAYRFLQLASEYKLFEDIALVFTDNGKKVWNFELPDKKIENLPFKIYNNDNFFVPFASGTSDYEALVVIPCSVGTMSKIANSISDNLLTRTADVMLKENRKLILVLRETPYNLLHIENMKKIILAGGKIIPANPSFYSKPENIIQLIDTVIQKVFNALKVNLNLINWL